jgi:hypothetical protein
VPGPRNLNTSSSATISARAARGAKRATFTRSYTVDIPAAVGGPTAYAGFTAATGGNTSRQEILNWTYTP